MAEPVPVEDIEVFFFHPWGNYWVPLTWWMEHGPFRRRGLSPQGVRHRETKNILPLDVVPLPYRNNPESRRLIREGILPDPWAHIVIPGVSPEELKEIDREIDEREEAIRRKQFTAGEIQGIEGTTGNDF